MVKPWEVMAELQLADVMGEPLDVFSPLAVILVELVIGAHAVRDRPTRESYVGPTEPPGSRAVAHTTPGVIEWRGDELVGL